MNRSEDDRVDFWCNGPDHPIRPGVLGVIWWDLVDLDESGFYRSSSNRTHGHSLVGVRCRKRGGPKVRGGVKWTTLVAVDARVGVIKALFYHKGTTVEKFRVFVELMLLPALAGTGRRIITYDRLTSHFGDVVSVIRTAGHIPIFRPVSSPDFGPVEWVFNFVDQFLQSHTYTLNDHNFKDALVAAFNCVTSHNIASYMHQAHFAVPGFEYKPYMKEQ